MNKKQIAIEIRKIAREIATTSGANREIVAEIRRIAALTSPPGTEGIIGEVTEEKTKERFNLWMKNFNNIVNRVEKLIGEKNIEKANEVLGMLEWVGDSAYRAITKEKAQIFQESAKSLLNK